MNAKEFIEQKTSQNSSVKLTKETVLNWLEEFGAEKYLRGYSNAFRPKKEEEDIKIDPQWAINAASEYFGIRKDELMGKSRTQRLVFPRYCIFKLLRDKTNWSLTDIGRFLGKDHATVLHGIRTIENDLRYNQEKEAWYQEYLNIVLS